ncbi:LANO_0E03004g1_1 [Lachancea nothofagi CBS 11611]|uniref:LANO_0E03004g1_1 n=1 Tax=Lachancea nothofagi CBS 11611 TaxID=1266666 RepID=A0A1G4JQR2_9SACH|nr:LANO_0E03004g1_1 [Lachancea nothofagi CBS 11611]
MLNRTQSFQNCKETDVPGYNDCPLFLYPPKRTTGEKNAVPSSQIDTYGGTKAATAPPPPMKWRSSSQNSSISVSSTGPQVTCKEKSDILLEIDAVLARDSKLSPTEFQYYKSKIVANIDKSLDHEHGRQTMSEILASLEEKEKVYKLLTEWMMSDTATGKWCPSFRKIISNLT